MRYQIFVAGQELDIYPKQIIGQTFQASAIGNGDLVSRKASFTNQITVPITNNNISVLEYANFINADSDLPYESKPCIILCEGLVVMKGIVVVKAAGKDFTLQFFDTVKDVFAKVGNKVLSELDFGDSPITWQPSFWDSKRASTTGWCCPVIDQGQMDDDIADGSIGDYYLPIIAVKDIYTAILENAGYTIVSGASAASDFYDNDEYFNALVMTYGREDAPWELDTVKMNEVLPDNMMQVDFLRDINIKFGIEYNVVGSSIELYTLETNLNNLADSVDWTAKRINRPKANISYAWPGWAQKNHFKYPETDLSALDLTLNPAYEQYIDTDGYLSVTNENISANRNVYESIFYSQEISRYGRIGRVYYQVSSASEFIQCATQKVWEAVPTSYIYDNAPKPMLCLLRDRSVPAGEESIVYDGSARTDYKVAYVVGYNVVQKTVKWRGYDTEQGFLDVYYAKLESVLQSRPKFVPRVYNLNIVDIASLNLLKLVFDDGNYYRIHQIKSFVPGRLTECELLKL